MKKITGTAILLCVIAGLLCACFQSKDEKMIEARMDTFLEAYNAGDMDAVMDCMDSATRENYDSMLQLYGMMGINVDDLFSWAVGQVSGDGSYKFGDLEIEMVSDTRASVRTVMYFEGNTSSVNKELQYTLIKEDGEWFIVG